MRRASLSKLEQQRGSGWCLPHPLCQVGMGALQQASLPQHPWLSCADLANPRVIREVNKQEVWEVRLREGAHLSAL